MRRFLAAVLTVLLALSLTFGQKRHPRTYRNVNGEQVHSPVFSRQAPAGATARCRDGSYSFSRHRSGTCSHHGGVAQWLSP